MLLILLISFSVSVFPVRFYFFLKETTAYETLRIKSNFQGPNSKYKTYYYTNQPSNKSI